VSDETTEQHELDLIRRVGLGERAAFADLYDLYSGILFSLALRILNDRAEAEDVLQEAFLQIWDRAASFDPALGKPFNWALTLARNKAIDRLRASRRRFRLAEQAATWANSLPGGGESSVTPVVQDEQAALVRATLTGLPKDQRQAIELAFFSGLTQREIATTLREPLGTVKARIRRGMLKLRDALAPQL